MIGANEKTIGDQSGNTVFVTTSDQSIAKYLRDAERLGFQTKGTAILAPRDDIHRVMYQDGLKEMLGIDL